MEELIQETEFRVAYEKGYDSYLCPCRCCHGGHRYSLQTIRMHLRLNKRDEMLNFSMLGETLRAVIQGRAFTSTGMMCF
jgi:hypothetical protein